MKHVTLFSGKRLFLRLALAATMIVFGGEKVWADTVIFGGSVASGWSYKNSLDNDVSPSYGELYDGGSYGTPKTYTSDNNITISTGQTIEISAKRSSTSSSNLPSIKVKYSSDNGVSWSEVVEFTETTISSNTEYSTAIVDDEDIIGTYKIQFELKNVYIERITLKDAPGTPNLSVSVSGGDGNFGTVRSNDSKTITVSNTGGGNMSVNISLKKGTDFTISKDELSDIENGSPKTFTVTFHYDEEDLGEKSDTITITPNAGSPKTIIVSANSVDPRMWEDFSEGIPSTWYNQDNSWSTSASGHTGEAYQTYNSSKILRTPRLTAEAGEAISFDVKLGGSTSSYKIIAKYSTNGTTWNTIDTYTTSGTKSFDAPSAGNYWIQFTGYYSSVDNMTGWTVSDATHLTKLGTADIPTSGLHHGTYTASVNVMELGGSSETVTAKLYFGEDVVATKVVSISGNRDETISLSYTPLEAWSGNVYIEITGDNIGRLTTSPKTVNITNPTVVLDEGSHESNPTCTSKVIQFKYTPKRGWGTICVPFSLTDHLNTIFGEECTAYELYSFSDGKLTFKTANVGTVSKPYLIYSPNAEDPGEDGFYLQGVTILSGSWSSSYRTQTKNGVTFQGTFDSMTAGSLDGCYGVTASGQIAKAGSGTQMKGYRAYLTTEAEVKMFVIDGDDATDIGLMQMVEGEDKAVYNISGQRVQKARKGLYIIGGKKVIIK